jgi:putative resolvase
MNMPKSYVKLSVWARQHGITYATAFRWFQEDHMPAPVIQTPSGTILVEAASAETMAPAPGGLALYARVSGTDQRADLERQLGRLAAAAASQGWVVTESVMEIGSGLSPKRPKLQRVLRDPAIQTIVVEHRDRLARFGVEQLEAVLAASGRRLVILDDREVADDLVRDMTEVLTSLCARLYGRRSAARRARAAMKTATVSPT